MWKRETRYDISRKKNWSSANLVDLHDSEQVRIHRSEAFFLSFFFQTPLGYVGQDDHELDWIKTKCIKDMAETAGLANKTKQRALYQKSNTKPGRKNDGERIISSKAYLSPATSHWKCKIESLSEKLRLFPNRIPVKLHDICQSAAHVGLDISSFSNRACNQ